MSIEFRGKTYTLSLSQMRKLVEGANKGGAFKGVKMAAEQKKADISKNKVVLPRVPI